MLRATPDGIIAVSPDHTLKLQAKIIEYVKRTDRTPELNQIFLNENKSLIDLGAPIAYIELKTLQQKSCPGEGTKRDTFNTIKTVRNLDDFYAAFVDQKDEMTITSSNFIESMNDISNPKHEKNTNHLISLLQKYLMNGNKISSRTTYYEIESSSFDRQIPALYNMTVNEAFPNNSHDEKINFNSEFIKNIHKIPISACITVYDKETAKPLYDNILKIAPFITNALGGKKKYFDNILNQQIVSNYLNEKCIYILTIAIFSRPANIEEEKTRKLLLQYTINQPIYQNQIKDYAVTFHDVLKQHDYNFNDYSMLTDVPKISIDITERIKKIKKKVLQFSGGLYDTETKITYASDYRCVKSFISALKKKTSQLFS